MARHREDHPEKYVELRNAYKRNGNDFPSQKPGAAQVEEIFDWAFRHGSEGFGQDDVIGIAAAAEGFRARKPVVSEALGALSRKGFVEAVPNSPYRIINVRSVLPADRFRMDYTFSMTSQLPNVEDLIVGSGPVEATADAGLGACPWFTAEDAHSFSRLQQGEGIAEGGTPALRAPMYHLVRVRTLPGEDGVRAVALLECVAFFLDADASPILKDELANEYPKSPLVALLERCGVDDLVTGATLLTVSPLTPALGAVIDELTARGVNPGRLRDLHQDHLKELYFLYSASHGGPVAAVTCYVNSDLLQLLVRDFSVLPVRSDDGS
ncbi:MAG: hypothetical protein ABIK09_18645 [Pseudomonadota bacterium]